MTAEGEGGHIQLSRRSALCRPLLLHADEGAEDFSQHRAAVFGKRHVVEELFATHLHRGRDGQWGMIVSQSPYSHDANLGTA